MACEIGEKFGGGRPMINSFGSSEKGDFIYREEGLLNKMGCVGDLYGDLVICNGSVGRRE